ncbi:hypothetical protein NN3_35300 [Nocardia neocaledoniensis NBRC 108232]|uniref:Uncharacterized protein n=1 Tax=Nocardia neocaledoniensis TaxID=236511 RepID=A0A317NUP6_9NOCA|nr:hypothetical protein [Nocardia neocaledoniensis]PWV79096.1 hypothetical protein DFR69_102155 [Nocardia neocaledoniensis]GEM32523.1 hypothetical protein NN3_35300 [Nocardia neocaledoniensis NBRC 108232]
MTDAAHTFRYHPYGPNSYYTSRLEVRLEDGATPAESAAVVRVMGDRQLPPHYRGDSTTVEIRRSADSYSGGWLFGRDVERESSAAATWTRVSAAEVGAQIHWVAHGTGAIGDAAVSVRAGSETEPQRATAAMRRIIQAFPELATNDWTVSPPHGEGMLEQYSRLAPSVTDTDRHARFPTDDELALWEWFLTDQPISAIVEVAVSDPPGTAGHAFGVTVFPPVGEKFDAAQATRLADRHLRYLAERGGVVDYRIVTRAGLGFAVLVGGCPERRESVAPESEPFTRQYERC